MVGAACRGSCYRQCYAAGPLVEWVLECGCSYWPAVGLLSGGDCRSVVLLGVVVVIESGCWLY